MKISIKAAASLSLVLCLTAFKAQANLVYDNGPINGTIQGRTIDPPFAVSDSFTVSSATSLTSAQAGLWTSSGAPTSVNWSIGTTAFGSDISSGTANAITNTFFGTGLGFYPIYESAFDITGSLSAGTYYFTLQNAAPANIFWDVNDGPSSASQTDVGRIASESFQLYGSSSVPDGGSTLALLGLALGGIAAARRKLSVA